MTLAIVVVGVLLASAAAGVFWAIVDGRRGRHVAAPAHRPRVRATYIDRFYAPRVTIWIGQPQPGGFADIAAANADVDVDFRTYAELYLVPVPEETR